MVRNNTAKRKVLVVASTAHAAHLRGIARYARENDWHLVTDAIFTGVFPLGWRGDGILALVANQPEIVAQVCQSGLPCVTIPRTDGPARLPCVEEDHLQIGQEAADHFLERAYRSFAWAPLTDDEANRERLVGFQARLAEHGYRCQLLPPAHARLGAGSQNSWSDYQCGLVARMRQLPRPTAIFAFNDCVAANLVDVCRDNGFCVPEEFAILGVDNDPLICDSAAVPLSSIEPNHEEMAYRAAGILGGLMDGEPPGGAVISVPPRGVVMRVSTNASAVADPRVARALAYIAENYPNPMLGVPDVAGAVGLSRRHLERSVRDVTGRTVREHIIMARMYEASRLLTTHARAKCSDIAALVGLGGGRNFFRTFRRFFGRSPKAHREWAAGTAGHRSAPTDAGSAPPAAERSGGATALALLGQPPERYPFASPWPPAPRDQEILDRV